MKTIEILSACFQFLAFWFAAPELLGQQTLERFEDGLKRFITSIPMLILPLVMGAYGITFLVLATLKVMKSRDGGVTEREVYEYYILLAICTAAYLAFIFTYKRLKKWIQIRVTDPIIMNLIHKNEIRKQALVIGAIMFSIGFLLQLVSIALN